MTKKERIAAALEKEIEKRDAINERIAELEKQLQAEETMEVQKLMNRAEKFASGELAASLAKMKAAYNLALVQRIKAAEAEEAAAKAAAEAAAAPAKKKGFFARLFGR